MIGRGRVSDFNVYFLIYPNPSDKGAAPLTVNGTRGATPLIVEKFVKKNCKCNQYDFCTVKTIFETLSALGACLVTIIGVVVQWNLSIADMLYSGHLSIAGTFSENQWCPRFHCN